MQISSQTQQPTKKKRGGYRPNSGRKRIHPIKEPKTLASTSVYPSRSQTVTTHPSLLRPSMISLKTKKSYIVQTFRDLACLIQREHQKLERNEEIQVQDFEVELLLGLALDPLRTELPTINSYTFWQTSTSINSDQDETTSSRYESKLVLPLENEPINGFFMYDDESKKNRVFATNDERYFLEDNYLLDSNPCMERMEEFCMILGWEMKRLKQWFSNKRSYDKRKMIYTTHLMA